MIYFLGKYSKKIRYYYLKRTKGKYLWGGIEWFCDNFEPTISIKSSITKEYMAKIYNNCLK